MLNNFFFPDLSSSDSLFQNSFFQSVLSSIKDSIIITSAEDLDNPGPKIIYVNDAFCKMNGYTLEEVIGKSPRFLQGEKTNKETLATLKNALQNHESVRVSLTNYRKDGSDYEVELDINPIFNEDKICTHYVSIQREVISTKSSENNLFASELFNQNIIESSPDCVKILDTEGKIKFVNKNGKCLMEMIDFEDLHDTIWSDLWDDEQKPTAINAIKQAALGNESKFFAPCKTARGSEKWWSVIVRPIFNSKNEVDKILSISRDISAERFNEKIVINFDNELEDKIANRTNELYQKNLELENANLELSSFNYIASHDLQEPLRKIQMFSNLIATSENKLESLEKNIPKIISASNRMRNLITALHTYTSVKNTDLKLQPVNLNLVIEEVMQNLSEQILENSATISTSKLPTIKGIPVLLVQLFSNLLENSLKYRKESASPVIAITASEVEGNSIIVNKSPNYDRFYKVIYTDNGIGFDNSQKEKIFNLFQRLHQKHEYSGSGIGLTICKNIIQKHGGWIEAEGILGVSGTFIMYFPFK